MRLMLVSLAQIVLVLSPGASSADTGVDCGDWPNAWFFEIASPNNVLDCLATGADPNARGSGLGWTPLHLAAAVSEYPAVIEALAAAGADLEARFEGGRTPLHVAAGFSEHPEVIEALVAAGASLEARAGLGMTPLHTAARSSEHPEVIEALVAAGASLEARAEGGRTPLHSAAVHSEHPEVIEALVAAGADPNARTEDGRIPWDFAKPRESLKTSKVYWYLNEARF